MRSNLALGPVRLHWGLAALGLRATLQGLEASSREMLLPGVERASGLHCIFWASPLPWGLVTLSVAWWEQDQCALPASSTFEHMQTLSAPPLPLPPPSVPATVISCLDHCGGFSLHRIYYAAPGVILLKPKAGLLKNLGGFTFQANY